MKEKGVRKKDNTERTQKQSKGQGKFRGKQQNTEDVAKYNKMEARIHNRTTKRRKNNKSEHERIAKLETPQNTE